jgi:phosphonate metabolism protein PhnN/1,5-bisphosphokinase (PRPP-forming)
VRGTLFLIVGPSGAGKDTLIAAARERLPAHHRFPRRTITRPATPGGEDHVAVDMATFEARERSDGFALSWRAHSNAYGIPASMAADLAAGNHVVVNASRTVIAQARRLFAPTRVILVTAPPETLRARLLTRGREAEDAVAQRLHRSPAAEPDTVIVNDGPLQHAVDAFVAALKG